ncbi:hypothetical protein AALB_4261 [Agarivorans albus MKT 106]|uniref:Uncharacterized protein n=1 Tax=Agarivorans albus MKT 106 TaxID=1331007 RepID=R9PUH5_AGAAL|nr:hypothetical protein AALB_4261 [Agarivorans albus MKT 106]
MADSTTKMSNATKGAQLDRVNLGSLFNQLVLGLNPDF